MQSICGVYIYLVDCGPSPSISNGLSGIPTRTTFGETATYTCNPGYQRSGSSTVTCEASGNWSTAPILVNVTFVTPATTLN